MGIRRDVFKTTVLISTLFGRGMYKLILEANFVDRPAALWSVALAGSRYTKNPARSVSRHENRRVRATGLNPRE